MGDRIVVMKDGAIRQVGTPLELYDDPNDIFVATFIGSPPMNILSATVEQEALALADGTRIAMPARLAAALGPGRHLRVGLRAEQLRAGHHAARAPDAAGELRVAAVVRERDDLGQDVIAGLEVGGERVAVRTDRTVGAEPGAPIELAIDAQHARFFDAQSEERIRVPV